MEKGEDTVNRIVIGIGGQGSIVINNLLRMLKALQITFGRGRNF
ncbi:MAG TPA: hypothetical protein VMW67_08095 [Desulfobacteria bacterium]|nr:hypothetical protein [Desulfobacteria bacterium]